MSATPVTAASMDIECAAAPAAAAPQKSTARRWGLAAAVLATAALSVGAIAALTTQQSQQAAQLAADSRSLLNIAPGTGSLRSIRLQIGISTVVDIPTKTAEMGDRPKKNGDPGYEVKVDMGLMYQPVKDVNENYFKEIVDKYVGGNVTPVIVLTAHGFNLDAIIRGDLDTDLQRISGLAASRGEIWFRPLHEANNNWYSWGVYSGNNNTAEKFRQAFEHMSNKLTNYGALGNVKIQLGLNNKSPNDMNQYETRPFEKYMPARSSYHNACVSAYNWGDEKSGGYKSFSEVFTYAYNNLAEVTDASLGLCEGSTVGYGGNKGDWYEGAISTLQKLGRVSQAHFFLINVKEDKYYDFDCNEGCGGLGKAIHELPQYR